MECRKELIKPTTGDRIEQLFYEIGCIYREIKKINDKLDNMKSDNMISIASLRSFFWEYYKTYPNAYSLLDDAISAIVSKRWL